MKPWLAKTLQATALCLIFVGTILHLFAPNPWWVVGFIGWIVGWVLGGMILGIALLAAGFDLSA